MTRIHGGPDAYGVPRFDFSSNSNACGPCPLALELIQQADARAYPDAHYTALRAQLAAFHGVAAWRVVLASSASEFIFRMTALVAKQNALQAKVNVPVYGYGDYVHAARAWHLDVVDYPDQAHLVWACEPSSPLGNVHTTWPTEQRSSQRKRVLDLAYEPLRLTGQPSLSAAQREDVWQLWTPNKALGLTGVRAAYAIAPHGAQMDALALEQLGASWPIGAHGVAFLMAWTKRDVQDWLTESLTLLKTWKARQIDLLQNLGWTCLSSESNFFCASPLHPMNVAEIVVRLRAQGIKLRDTTSFGLPKYARISVQAPDAQDALALALKGMP